MLAKATVRGSLVSVEENKAVIRRLFDEVYNDQNLDVLGELVAEDVVNHAAAEPHTLATSPGSFERPALRGGRETSEIATVVQHVIQASFSLPHHQPVQYAHGQILVVPQKSDHHFPLVASILHTSQQPPVVYRVVYRAPHSPHTLR